MKIRTVQTTVKFLSELEIFSLSWFVLLVEALSMLTVTSKALRNLVELYKGTTLAQTHLLPKTITHQIIPISQEDFFCTTYRRLGKTCLRNHTPGPVAKTAGNGLPFSANGSMKPVKLYVCLHVTFLAHVCYYDF